MVDSSHPEGKALCCANCSHCRHFILSFVCLLTDLTVYESLLIQAFCDVSCNKDGVLVLIRQDFCSMCLKVAYALTKQKPQVSAVC